MNPKNERPYIVRFENQTDTFTFDVVIHHADCATATEWARGYFGTVKYLHSDFDGNHTYHRERQNGEPLRLNDAQVTQLAARAESDALRYGVLAKTAVCHSGHRGIDLWTRKSKYSQWYHHGVFGSDSSFDTAMAEIDESFRLRYEKR